MAEPLERFWFGSDELSDRDRDDNRKNCFFTQCVESCLFLSGTKTECLFPYSLPCFFITCLCHTSQGWCYSKQFSPLTNPSFQVGLVVTLTQEARKNDPKLSTSHNISRLLSKSREYSLGFWEIQKDAAPSWCRFLWDLLMCFWCMLSGKGKGESSKDLWKSTHLALPSSQISLPWKSHSSLGKESSLWNPEGMFLGFLYAFGKWLEYHGFTWLRPSKFS